MNKNKVENADYKRGYADGLHNSVKHGHWKYYIYKFSGDKDELGWYRCSVCNHANWINEDNYCSYCGAKMDEVVEDE